MNNILLLVFFGKCKTGKTFLPSFVQFLCLSMEYIPWIHSLFFWQLAFFIKKLAKFVSGYIRHFFKKNIFNLSLKNLKNSSSSTIFFRCITLVSRVENRFLDARRGKFSPCTHTVSACSFSKFFKIPYLWMYACFGSGFWIMGVLVRSLTGDL